MTTQLATDKTSATKPIEHAREALTGAVDEVRERSRTLYSQAKERARGFEHDYEDYVRSHPMRSTAVALGVGFGVGLLIGVLAARR